CRRVWRNYFHVHERRIRVCPRERLLFGLKKFVDHDGASLAASASGPTRRLPISHCTSGVDRRKSRSVRQNHPASVRNSFWIDSAMADAQSRTGGGCVLAGVAIGAVSTARPVNRNSGKQRIVPGKTTRQCRYSHQKYKRESFRFHVLRWLARRTESSGRPSCSLLESNLGSDGAGMFGFGAVLIGRSEASNAATVSAASLRDPGSAIRTVMNCGCEFAQSSAACLVSKNRSMT